MNLLVLELICHILAVINASLLLGVFYGKIPIKYHYIGLPYAILHVISLYTIFS